MKRENCSHPQYAVVQDHCTLCGEGVGLAVKNDGWDGKMSGPFEAVMPDLELAEEAED